MVISLKEICVAVALCISLMLVMPIETESYYIYISPSILMMGCAFYLSIRILSK